MKPLISPRVAGLAMSWRRAPKRSAVARSISSASGSARKAAASSARSSPTNRRQVRLDVERVLEHLERVPVDVEVMVGALADALGRLQLGEDDGGDPQLVEEREAAERVGAGEELAQLGQLALAGGLGGAGGALVGERDGLRRRSSG